MEKSMKYFSHYYKEIQTTKAKFKDYIAKNDDSETEKLIELKDFSGKVNYVAEDALETKDDSDVPSDQQPTEEEPVDEKSSLIRDIKVLNMTLEDLTQKMIAVKTDTTKLKQENAVIDEYVVNLMEQSKTFEPTDF
eukprot:GFUD01033993.1.p1 GENE.GFUD01033993.1~~GFUD01033993.1.p1  ORF type:complete len:136 (+),score=54.69 GFUD01033993.1:44-451(+)